ncbi:MAG: hypothetical protein M3463_16470 [Verrucomicrobiota bacterium]|nr:hypothetical protein [Verrucomicrobiota bacterium]
MSSFENPSAARSALRRVVLSLAAGLACGCIAAMALFGWTKPHPSSPAPASRVPRPFAAKLPMSNEAQERDLEAALQRIRPQPAPSLEELAALDNLVQRWLFTDPVACVNYLERTNALGLIDPALLKRAILRIAGDDYAHALRLAGEMRSSLMRDHSIRAAFERQIDIAPAQAFALLGSLPQHLRVNLGRRLAGEWGDKDPKAAVETLLVDKDLDRSRIYINDSLQSWALKAPEEAVEFLLRSPEGKIAGGSRAQFADLVLSIGGEIGAALAGLNERFPPSPERLNNRRLVLPQWAIEHPDAALQWAQKLEGDNEQLDAILSIALGALSSERPEKGLEIAERLPAGAVRTRVYTGYAELAGRKDPARTAAWCERIEDPFVRAGTMRALSSVWVNHDPGAAITFAASQNSADTGPAWLPAVTEALAKSLPKNPPAESPKWMSDLSPQARAALKSAAAIKAPDPHHRRLLELLE